MKVSPTMKGVVIASVAWGALALVVGCGTHASSDAGKIDTTPANVIQFPHGFRNVSAKCDGPNMVYSGSSGADDSLNAAVAVVANDPRCQPNPAAAK